MSLVTKDTLEKKKKKPTTQSFIQATLADKNSA